MSLLKLKFVERLLAGFTPATTPIAAGDSLTEALQKAQGQINVEPGRWGQKALHAAYQTFDAAAIAGVGQSFVGGGSNAAVTDAPSAAYGQWYCETSALGSEFAVTVHSRQMATPRSIVTTGAVPTSFPVYIRLKQASVWQPWVLVSAGTAVSAERLAYQDGLVTHVDYPLGGSYYNGAASVTGAIRVQLPGTQADHTNAMVSFVVDVYDYLTAKAFEVHVAGYTFSSGAFWVNTSAAIIADPAANGTMNYTVRFGYEGLPGDTSKRYCIYIGEATTVFRYPAVKVRDVKVSFSRLAPNLWDDGWTIDQTTAFDGIGTTHTKTCIGDYLGGLPQSAAATASTIAARNAAGQIFATSLNQSSTDNENSVAATQFMQVGVDGFLRKSSAAFVAGQLVAPLAAAGVGSPSVQNLTASGTWTKPAGCTSHLIELWAAGGSGGRSTTGSASGGGGGAYISQQFSDAELAASVAFLIGAGGVAASGGASANGNAGGDTSFGALLKVFGGGGGYGSAVAGDNFGAGGGGVYGAGNAVSAGFGGAPSSLNGSGTTNPFGGGGTNGVDLDSVNGGGAGSSTAGGGTVAQPPGRSVLGGCGGGGAGSSTAAAGASPLSSTGGGATGATGGVGAAPRSGGGGGSNGNGGAGTIPGGGGGASRGTGFSSGAGARGQIRITSW